MYAMSEKFLVMNLMMHLTSLCLSYPNSHSPLTSPIKCWDGIFSPSNLSSVLANVHARKHAFTSIINRDSTPRSCIEQAIQSILSELNDPSPYIDYWVRNPPNGPRSLEAHRDVDEGLCAKDTIPIGLGSDIKIGKQRCPNNGHVLYVDVEGSIGSPTLVWEEEGGAVPGPPGKLSSVWTVPSVSNRFLRFDGICLHAVAYPPLSFLEDRFEAGECDNHSNDDAKSGNNGRRAVILFNTWDEPPSYPAVGEDLSIGETIHFENDVLLANNSYCLGLTCWKTSPVINFERSGNHKDHGNPQSVSKLRVPLLGSQSRRGCEHSSLEMTVVTEQAKVALNSIDDVVCVQAVE